MLPVPSSTSPRRSSSPAPRPSWFPCARSTITRSASPARSRAGSRRSSAMPWKAAPRSTWSGSASSRSGPGELRLPPSGWGIRARFPDSLGTKGIAMEQVKLYDTTLRDGMGGPGMSLSVGEKLKVVRALDELGIQFIEAGFPSSNPKEAELFEQLAGLELEQATIAAFGMTRRRDRSAEEDGALRTIVECFAPVVCLVGKSWGLHLEKVIKVSAEENLAMIADSIGFCRGRGKRPLFDAEHFFDGYRDDAGYALECVRAAAGAGAENVTPCDTHAGSLAGFVAEAVAAVVADLGDGVEVGIHTHDDAGCAVANSLAAVEAGARLVQGTVNGQGERCGDANLATILPALQLKMGFEVVAPERLESLTQTSHYLDELCNMAPNPDQPYVGRHAFAHKAGMHAAGVEADARTFEHLDPDAVGNQREILASELSGKATIRTQATQAGLDLDEDAAARAVERLKEREHRGYHYEAAPASFELLLRREAGSYQPLVELGSFRVVTEKRADGGVETEATIKVLVDGERYLRVAEGNGPVNALDRALRGAIADRHPHLADVELTNYKVRILDESHGTGAVTRVLLDSTDHEREWGTIGVSENIIEASWEALVDSLEYAFQPRRAGRSRSPGPRSAPARRSWRWRCCVPAGSRWGRWGSASSASSPPGSGSRTRAPSPAAPPPCTSACGRWGGGPATRS